MNWLHKIAGIRVTISPEVTEMPVETISGKHRTVGPKEMIPIVREAIRSHFSSIDPKGSQFAASRYTFNVRKVREDYTGVTVDVQFLPNVSNQGSEVPLDPSSALYEYNMKYRGGRSGKTSYKTPKDAIESIQTDSSLAYRGMAWEEWISIQKSGIIRSTGPYNIGDSQLNLTFFSPDPATAMHYAHGFAPIQYQISQKRPGVIIAIPKEGLLSHAEFPDGVPSGELAARGSVPAESIRHAWMLVATETDDRGFLEFIIPWVPAWDTSNRQDPRMGVFKLGFDKVRTGSGRTSVVSRYVVRQIK